MPSSLRAGSTASNAVIVTVAINVNIIFNMTNTITVSVASSLYMLVGLLNQLPAHYRGLTDQRIQYTSNPYSNRVRPLDNPYKTLTNLFKAPTSGDTWRIMEPSNI